MILTWFLMTPVACRIASGIALLLLTVPCFGQERGRQTQVKPAPAHKNVPYGPHKQNLLDFWQAKSNKPTPPPLYIHDGGFIGGSKDRSARPSY